MLCRRSASLISMTRTSRAIASSILRKFSACACSVDENCSLSSLDTPSTSSATVVPKRSISCCLGMPESSSTSCSSAAWIAAPSSRQSVRISATASGCVMYGAPLLPELPEVGFVGEAECILDLLHVGRRQVFLDALGESGDGGDAGGRRRLQRNRCARRPFSAPRRRAARSPVAKAGQVGERDPVAASCCAGRRGWRHTLRATTRAQVGTLRSISMPTLPLSRFHAMRRPPACPSCRSSECGPAPVGARDRPPPAQSWKRLGMCFRQSSTVMRAMVCLEGKWDWPDSSRLSGVPQADFCAFSAAMVCPGAHGRSSARHAGRADYAGRQHAGAVDHPPLRPSPPDNQC